MAKKYSDARPPRTAPFALVLLACVAAASAASCARKGGSQADARSEAGTAEAFRSALSAARAPAAIAQPPRDSTSQARGSSPADPGAAAIRGRGAADRPAAAQRPAPPLAAGLRAFGLGARLAPRMPEDFSLGPLQSMRPASKDEEAALAVVRAFLDGVAAGKVDPAIFLPEARDALSSLLEPAGPAAGGEGAKPSPARVGAIGIEGADASLRVRLPGREGAARVEGLLSLRRAEGSWYVEALALDPPEAAALAFDPGARAAAR